MPRIPKISLEWSPKFIRMPCYSGDRLFCCAWRAIGVGTERSRASLLQFQGG